MLTKFGAIITEGRGKINGFVASRNTYGNYLRTKVTPANPSSLAQQLVRGQFTTLSQAWRGLTAAQRQGWAVLAGDLGRTNVFGDNVPLTAFNAFMRLNRNLQKLGVAINSDAPQLASVTGLTALTLTCDSGGQTVSCVFAPTPVPANHKLLYRCTGPVSPGKKFVRSEYRQLKVVAAAQVSPTALTTEYLAMFGALVAGQHVFVEAVLINSVTGQESGTLQADDIVAAG